MKAYIVIDGGTTNLRVFLIEKESRRIVASARAEGGVKYTAIDGNNARLRAMLRDGLGQVLEDSGLGWEDVERIIAFGMITSGMGLYEIPHLAAPVTADDLRCGMKTQRFEDIAPMEIGFIPGVRNFSGPVNADNVRNMDMMRGEETEAVGLYRLLGLTGSAMFILPGSHNKFVRMGEGGTILGCMTSISGELLDAITHHTILAGAVDASFCSEDTYDREYVLRGARECLESGLGRAAFSGRILRTLGDAEPAKIQSYLLGAVLAEDVKALRTFHGGTQLTGIYVAGKKPVRQAVLDVLEEAGCPAEAIGEQTASVMGITGALEIAL